MTKAETLTEAIAGHDVATFEETPDGLRAKCNRCDERLEDGHAYVFDACRAHVAAVALAWLEGRGWRQLPLMPLTPAASGKHYGHKDGEWFYGCDVCNPIREGGGA